MIVWQTSSDNSTWATMKTPESYKIDVEDLDNNSYRSVTTGELIRSVIAKSWYKVSMSFSNLTEAECTTIMNAIKDGTVYFKFLSPVFGIDGYVSFKGYVSKHSMETSNVDAGWSLSFNVVQSATGAWQ